MLQIVRKKLTPDEISPPNIRWDEDCDCIQQSPDGGATWVDVPAADPRTAPGFLKPPLVSDNARCDAAANMIAYLRSIIAVDLLASTNWSLATALLAILLLVFPGGVLIDLLLIAAGVVLTIGSEAITSAFMEDVYDGLLCIFYCNLDDDGQLDSDRLAAIVEAIETQYPGTVTTVFEVHNRALLDNGWNNAGSSGSEIGDCEDCVCEEHCFTVDLTLTNGSEYGIAPLFDTDTWVEGQGWQGHSYSGDHENDATLLWTLPATLHVTEMSAMVYREAGSGANSGTTLRALQPIVTYATDLVGSVFSDENGTTPDFLVFVQTPLAVDVDGISIDCNSGDESTVVYVTRMSIAYTGDEVFGGDNC